MCVSETNPYYGNVKIMLRNNLNDTDKHYIYYILICSIYETFKITCHVFTKTFFSGHIYLLEIQRP